MGRFDHFPTKECMYHGSVNGSTIAKGPLMASGNRNGKSLKTDMVLESP